MPQAPSGEIRIAVLLPRLPPATTMGGIATAHLHLLRVLAAAGWHVKAFAYQDSLDAENDAEVRRAEPRLLSAAVRRACALAFSLLSPGHRSHQLAEDLCGALAGLRMRASLARFRPQVIIAPDKGCPLALARKPPGARLVWMSHHNPLRFLAADIAPPLSAVDARLAARFEAFALREADLVLCPSRAMREDFTAAYRFDGPIEIFPNLICEALMAPPPEDPPLRRLLDLPDAAPLFYLPAAGTGVKGGGFLARILAEIGRRHRQAGVYLSGQVETEFRSALAAAPANVRVYAPGALRYEVNLARVRECDVAMAPARLESFGMALLEAAWLGVPVAAFAVGGIPEVVRRAPAGTNGELVPYADVERLCDAADDLLRRLRGGELSRASVAGFTRSEFSPDRAVAWLGSRLRSLLQPAANAQGAPQPPHT